MSANMSAREEVAAEGIEDDSRFFRGLLFGIAFSLPVWGGLIAVARLLT